MTKEETRKRLAKLPFGEKIKLLEKLRDRSQAIAASRRTLAQTRRKSSPTTAKPR